MLGILFSNSLTLAQDVESEHALIIEQTIAKARAYLGGDDKLKSVESITYKGSLLYSDGSTGSAEIIFKKPYFQRFVAVVGDLKETSGLNDLEAWRKQEAIGVEGSASLGVYDPAEMYNMRASVWEYLNFYEAPAGRNKSVEFVEYASVNGVDCAVLRYLHGDGIWFTRCFDRETGKLVRTVSSRGALFVESGEIMVDGIRFPKRLMTVFLNAPDSPRIEMEYGSIVLNRSIDNEIFKYPKLLD